MYRWALPRPAQCIALHRFHLHGFIDGRSWPSLVREGLVVEALPHEHGFNVPRLRRRVTRHGYAALAWAEENEII